MEKGALHDSSREAANLRAYFEQFQSNAALVDWIQKNLPNAYPPGRLRAVSGLETPLENLSLDQIKNLDRTQLIAWASKIMTQIEEHSINHAP